MYAFSFAHGNTVGALSFVSLLLSKENPSQAGTTLAPDVRELAGIGTLGASKLKDSSRTEERARDELAIATGWKLIAINKMVDSLMAAADTLEKEMASETKYWADILAVRENNWAVCFIPGEPRTLGVRFGFSEAAPEFKNNSMAPLRKSEDGTIRLVTGRIGRGSQRVRVAIEKDGRITGISALPRRPADDAPLQDHVLEARNTAFSQELWHEINREARMLLALGVNIHQSSVTWNFQPGTKLILTLEDLSDTESPIETLSHNWIANAASLYIHILLSYAHRQNYTRRTYPQNPPPDRSNPHPVHPILRPLIARAKHIVASLMFFSFLEQLVSLSHRAGITTAAYTALTSGPPSRIPPQAYRGPKPEDVAGRLIYAMEIFIDLMITPEARLKVGGKSHIMPYVGHRFRVFLPSSARPGGQNPQNGVNVKAAGGNDSTGGSKEQKQQQVPDLFETAYPPATEPYQDPLSVMEYLRSATARVLASRLAEAVSRRLADEMRDGDGCGAVSWTETLRGPTIGIDGRPREVCVNLYHDNTLTTNAARAQQQQQRLVLRLDAQWLVRSNAYGDNSMGGGGGGEGQGQGEDVQRREAMWYWTADGTSNAGGQGPEDVVFAVLAGEG